MGVGRKCERMGQRPPFPSFSSPSLNFPSLPLSSITPQTSYGVLEWGERCKLPKLVRLHGSRSHLIRRNKSALSCVSNFPDRTETKRQPTSAAMQRMSAVSLFRCDRENYRNMIERTCFFSFFIASGYKTKISPVFDSQVTAWKCTVITYYYYYYYSLLLQQKAAHKYNEHRQLKYKTSIQI